MNRNINISDRYKIQSKQPKALIIINGQINYQLLLQLSMSAELILCADGGANVLYDTFINSQHTEIIPKIIIGDLDSIRKEIIEYYQKKGTIIIQDSNQNNTDLEKCVEQALLTTNDQVDIFLLGSFGMRLDHTLSVLSNLLKYQSQHQNRRFIMLGEDSILRVLLPGSYEIEIDQEIEQMKGSGLVPAGQQNASVYTEGFEWNLSYDTQLKFGSFISTSNEIITKTVFIDTKDNLFFITQIQNSYKCSN